MRKIRKNKIPIFLKTHPLMIESYLKLYDYIPIFFKREETRIVPNKRNVYLLLSLLELEFFMKSARSNDVKRTRLVAFSTAGEIAFFSRLKKFMDIRRNKKLGVFIPHFVFLSDFAPTLTNWTVKSSSNPVRELDSSIKLASSLLELI